MSDTPARYIHISAPLVDVFNPATRTVETQVSQKRFHKTLNEGRNAEKRAARAQQVKRRAFSVSRTEIGRAPKIKYSARMELLANRRLRQVAQS